MKSPDDLAPPWLDWVRRMQAIAQNGLTYARDPFDQQRYQQLRALSAEILASATARSLPGEAEALARAFTSGAGYTTPKLDVRAAVFRPGPVPTVLMVKERSDGGWTLPGGWVDVGESPSLAVEKEVREEAGYEVRASKLLALLDRDRHGHPAMAEHVWKVFLRCEIVGESRAPGGDGLETDAVAFFAEDALPSLSLPRVTPSQIARLFAHHRDPTLPTDFD
ncbi:MAG: NUDIX hydrolase [Polyangiales bacterium]